MAKGKNNRGKKWLREKIAGEKKSREKKVEAKIAKGKNGCGKKSREKKVQAKIAEGKNG